MKVPIVNYPNHSRRYKSSDLQQIVQASGGFSAILPSDSPDLDEEILKEADYLVINSTNLYEERLLIKSAREAKKTIVTAKWLIKCLKNGEIFEPCCIFCIL